MKKKMLEMIGSYYRQLYRLFLDFEIWNACVPNLTWADNGRRHEMKENIGNTSLRTLRCLLIDSQSNLDDMGKFYLPHPICQNLSDKLNYHLIVGNGTEYVSLAGSRGFEP